MIGTRVGGSIAAVVTVVSLLLGATGSVLADDGTVPAPNFLNSAEKADWRQFRGTADHRGWNTAENVLSLANVGQLQMLWRAGGGFNSSPAVANGIVYNGDANLSAYPAQCRTDGGNCAALWSGGTGYPDWASPAVGGGMVYMQSVTGLRAFTVGCRSDGGQCSPVWTGTNADAAYTSPALANGWLFAATGQGQLQAYDTARCAAAGGTCSPDWVADTSGETQSSPAVSKGVVYIVDAAGILHSYPAHCGTGGATCSPIWSADIHSGTESSPAVANGVLYITTPDAQAYAFSTTCGTAGAMCDPIWHAQLIGGHTHASAAVTDSTVYFVTGHRILAYSAACIKGGGDCSPLWLSGKRSKDGGFASSPAIANGVLYIAIQGVNQANGKLVAFNANCGTDGRTCTAIWRSPVLGGMTNSSPAVAHGMVYVASNGGTFYAFGLPPTP